MPSVRKMGAPEFFLTDGMSGYKKLAQFKQKCIVEHPNTQCLIADDLVLFDYTSFMFVRIDMTLTEG